jgi:hypothetical protein
MSLSTIVLLLSLALGLLGSGLAYHKGKTAGRQEALTTLQEDEERQRQDAAAIQETIAGAISQIKVINKTLIQKTEREIVKDPIYIDCKHSPDGLQLINSALSGTPGANDASNTELSGKSGGS